MIETLHIKLPKKRMDLDKSIYIRLDAEIVKGKVIDILIEVK